MTAIDPALYQPSEWHVRFHQSAADETMGGGSAGPGKSLGLLWDPIATQAVVEHARMTQSESLLDTFPAWLADLCRQYPIQKGASAGHALHMRRSFPQLRETIDRSMRMFPRFDPGAKYSRDDHRWTFSSGYRYTFGHCLKEEDFQNYLSQQYTHLGLDEAFQFTERQFDELDARVRTSDPVLLKLKRTRLMTNPAPGWIKKRYVDPCPEGNTILKRRVHNPVTGETRFKTLLFLPAKLDDNPDKAFVEDYKFKLLSKPAHIRSRYLYGDWSSVEGGYFEDDWNPTVHVVKPFKIPRSWPKFRSIDWGFKQYGTCGWFAMDPEDNLYLFYEFNFRLMKDVEVAERIVDIEKQFGFWDVAARKSRLTGVADTQLWEERGDSGLSKAAAMATKGVYWQPADKASIARNCERVTSRLRDYDENKPPSFVVFEGCKKTREMFSAIGVEENDSTVPDKKSDLKHWLDMVCYGTARASRGVGSVVMDMHKFDVFEEDEPATAARGGSFGYGIS